ncbi:hypothetical protein M758_UG085100 [Ceratodon purpureus]|nr:hypothetical protein M758_UG085100 [Ceratodon purpureus]
MDCDGFADVAGDTNGRVRKKASLQDAAKELLRCGSIIAEEWRTWEESLRLYQRARNWLEGVTICFGPPIHSKFPQSLEITSISLQRLRMEAQILGANVVDTVGYTTTHVLTYRRPEQVLNPSLVLQSLGEKDISKVITLSPFWHPKGHPIKVVYHDWLEDSLAVGELLPEENYSTWL